jgi:hypothetical protein
MLPPFLKRANLPITKPRMAMSQMAFFEAICQIRVMSGLMMMMTMRYGVMIRIDLRQA